MLSKNIDASFSHVLVKFYPYPSKDNFFFVESIKNMDDLYNHVFVNFYANPSKDNVYFLLRIRKKKK